MKKYLPIGFITFTFLGYLISQVVFNHSDSTAKPSEKLKKQYMHYEDVLKKSTFSDLDGEKYSDIGKSHKVVIVNFWASWCLPCLEEIPSMVKLKQKYDSSELLIISINTDEKDDFKEVKKILKKYEVNFPVIRDHKGDHVKDFLIEAIPVSIVFNQGKVVQLSNEAVDFVSAEFIEKLDKLIKTN